MNEWSLLDWAARFIGISILIQSVFFISGKKILLYERYSGRRTVSDHTTPNSRNFYRFAGVVGIILGVLMIIYGSGILDVLFAW